MLQKTPQLSMLFPLFVSGYLAANTDSLEEIWRQAFVDLGRLTLQCEFYEICKNSLKNQN